MSRLLHTRGDLGGMFLFFTCFFLGLWQVVIAWKRLSGLSLTGWPDRKPASYVIGFAIMAGSCAWYFSGDGHFASADLEGIETLIVMTGGLLAASAIQFLAAHIARLARLSLEKRKRDVPPDRQEEGEDLKVTVGGAEVPASLLATTAADPGPAVLLLHDYGGSRADVGDVGLFLAGRGHTTLFIDLDGHGENPRDIGDPSMDDLLAGALEALRSRAAGEIAAVGVGIGGLLAMHLASTGRVSRAVAIDPPARDEEGHHDVNSLREYGIAGVLAETARPTARGEGGKRIGLAKLIASLPGAERGSGGGGKVTIIGTRAPWLNYSLGLTDFARLSSPFEPVFLKGAHATLQSEQATLEVVSGALG